MANAKLDIDISAFNANVKTATGILKGLDAEMKATDATFKATGNSEKQLADKTKVLNSQIRVQKGIIDQAKQALDALSKQGVAEADAEYQKWYATLMKATAGMNNAQAELNALNSSTLEAASGADQLTSSMNGISKKISLDQVISGIDKITTGLENAAKKAVKLGEDIWNSIMDSASYADDVSTMATRLGLTDDQVQRMMYVADRFEAPVETMAKTWKKLKNNMANDSEDMAEAFKQLGVQTHEMFGSPKYGDPTKGAARDYIDVFWEVGEAIMKVTDASEQERLAQKLLGRSWDEMIPLFTAGREAYEAALEEAPAASENAVEAAAALNDRVKELEKSWDTLKLEVVGAVAPALEKGADALAKVLDQLTTYLQSEDGQKLLEGLGTAVTNLFDDLGNINAEDLANNVTSVITGLTDGLNWLNENWESVKTGLITVVEAWAALEVTGGILDIVKVVSGLTSLTTISSAGAAAGTSWASAFASAAMKAAPFLAFLYTLLNPSSSANDSADLLVDKDGNVNVQAAEEAGLTEAQAIEAAQSQQVNRNNKQAVMEATGMTEKQISLLQHFWTNYKEVAEKGADAGGDAMQRYNEYGQRLKEEFAGQEKQLAMYAKKMEELFASGERGDKLDWSFFNIDSEGVEIPIIPEAPDGAAAMISKQVGIVDVAVNLVPNRNSLLFSSKISRLLDVGNANGLNYVPNEGLYHLHRGERVVPAREVASRSFSSNLYVENMNMGGGLSADALAAAIAGRNRRMMAGYGS